MLATVLDREHPDLVVFGQQSEDGVGGVLLAAIADLMQRPFASQASALDVEEKVRVTRQTESGDEVLEMPLPALVSVGDSINEPRYTSLKGVMAAKRKPLETVALSDLGAWTLPRWGRPAPVPSCWPRVPSRPGGRHPHR